MKRNVVWRGLAAMSWLLPVAVTAGPPTANKEIESLLAQGDAFRTNGQMREALWAYREAAKGGDARGACGAGQMLYQAGLNSRGRERILDLSEGLGDLVRAATNHLPQACAALSSACLHGAGVQTNLIAAYAWMELAAEQRPTYRTELDHLVVQLKPNEVQQAQDLAHDYSQGIWPADLVRPVDEGDPRLKIKGITVGGRVPLVILNRVTFTKGDSQEVVPEKTAKQAPGNRLSVTCLEIGDNYVLVAVAGESHLKLLSASNVLQ